MEIEGITAVITGSSGQLGGFIAMALAKAGCNCICHYNSNKQRANELVRRIESLSANALAVGADLTKAEQIEHLFAEAREFGGVRILINSAACFSRQPLSEITFGQAQQVFAVNLTAAIMASRVFAEHIKIDPADSRKVTGKIINIADIGGIRPWANYTVYCSSKAGLIGATKSLAKELAPAVCVNSIAPGVVNVKQPADGDKSQRQRQLEFIPMGRFAEPQDITDAIMFLLGNDYITGQVLNVDGGRCI